eukprot:2578314-Amphidinium_carterae.2
MQYRLIPDATASGEHGDARKKLFVACTCLMGVLCLGALATQSPQIPKMASQDAAAEGQNSAVAVCENMMAAWEAGELGDMKSAESYAKMAEFFSDKLVVDYAPGLAPSSEKQHAQTVLHRVTNLAVECLSPHVPNCTRSKQNRTLP